MKSSRSKSTKSIGKSKEQFGRKEKLLESEQIEETSECLFDLPWHSFGALVLFISVYVKCTSASIPSGDSGDFIMAAHHFGVAHPPGYPLFVTCGYFWMKILPFGNPAYKLNLLTSLIGALAAFIIYITTYKITNFIPSAVYASAMFAFSHLIWFHSIGAEIFALNNLFCGILLYWVVRFQRSAVSKRARVAMEASFLSGLSMCNQHTSFLFIGVIGFWMFLSLLQDKAITLKQFWWTGAAFCLGLLPYIQLPISAYFSNAPNTWGDHRSFSGIWRHFLRDEYGTLRLSADDDVSGDIWGNLKMCIQDLINEMGTTTLLLSALSLLLARYFQNQKNIVYVYAVSLVVYLLFFCNQANLDISDKSKQLSKGVLERFWMQSNVAVSILSGCGLWFVYSLISQRHKSSSHLLHCFLCAAALSAGAHQIGINYNDCDMSSNFMVRDFGKKMLDSVPNNSVLLVKGDLGIPAMYLRYSEFYREDLDLVDQELMGFPWYKSMVGPRYNKFIFPYDRELYYRKVERRRNEKEPFTYNFENVFDVHRKAGVPVYIFPASLKEGDNSWEESYEVVPGSMADEVRHKAELYSLGQYLDTAYQMEFDSSVENCDKTLYPVRSWEYMIAVQCGNNAFALPEYAHVKLAEDGAAHLKVENRSVMIKIFELYRRVCEALTIESEDGKSKTMFETAHHETYGIMSYFLYLNYMQTNERVEAGKYARVMTKQLETFLSLSSDAASAIARIDAWCGKSVKLISQEP
ncbi:hypothetical protein ACHWQZ_G017040 [Mnemiopsis leidyi]